MSLYPQNRIYTKHRKTNPNDETGVYDKRIVNTVTTFEMADCLKENCAKWQDGKCIR